MSVRVEGRSVDDRQLDSDDNVFRGITPGGEKMPVLEEGQRLERDEIEEGDLFSDLLSGDSVDEQLQADAPPFNEERVEADEASLDAQGPPFNDERLEEEAQPHKDVQMEEEAQPLNDERLDEEAPPSKDVRMEENAAPPAAPNESMTGDNVVSQLFGRTDLVLRENEVDESTQLRARLDSYVSDRRGLENVREENEEKARGNDPIIERLSVLGLLGRSHPGAAEELWGEAQKECMLDDAPLQIVQAMIDHVLKGKSVAQHCCESELSAKIDKWKESAEMKAPSPELKWLRESISYDTVTTMIGILPAVLYVNILCGVVLCFAYAGKTNVYTYRKNGGMNYVALQTWRRYNAVGLWSLGLALAYCVFRQLRFVHLQIVTMIRRGILKKKIEDIFALDLLAFKVGHIDIKIDNANIGTCCLWKILDCTYWGGNFGEVAHNAQMGMVKVSDGGINLGKDLTIGCITSNLHNMWYCLFVKLFAL